MKDFFYNKNPMNILSYVSKSDSNDELYGSKIAQELGINQGGTSKILKQFQAIGLLKSKTVGKTIVYNAVKDNSLYKYFRIFENILELDSLLTKIKSDCRKIILYGSCAKGEDTVSSDIDLFIVSDDKETVREAISSYTIDREINPVIVTTFELIDMEKEDKVYLEEVQNGLELWGGKIE